MAKDLISLYQVGIRFQIPGPSQEIVAVPYLAILKLLYWTPGVSRKGPMKQSLSVLPSFRLSGRFLGIVSLVFSKFWHDARNPYEVVHDSRIFQKKNFCTKNWENGPKMGQKQDFFLNILGNCVIKFYRICSIMKIQNICCVPTQIPYLGKFLFLRYGPKCSQPIRLQEFLINHISRTNQ